MPLLLATSDSTLFSQERAFLIHTAADGQVVLSSPFSLLRSGGLHSAKNISGHLTASGNRRAQ
jgi:hypothetical protein